MHAYEDVWASLHHNSRYDFSESNIDRFEPVFIFRVRSGVAKRAAKEVEMLLSEYSIAKRIHIEIAGSA